MQDTEDLDALKIANAWFGLPVVKDIVFIGNVVGEGRAAEYCILKAGFEHEALRSTRMAYPRLESVLVPVLDRDCRSFLLHMGRQVRRSERIQLLHQSQGRLSRSLLQVLRLDYVFRQRMLKGSLRHSRLLRHGTAGSRSAGIHTAVS